jgi:hypothetical protein
VTWRRPPESFQTSHESIVPQSRSPRRAASRAAGDVVENPFDLGGGKVGVEDEAGLGADAFGEAPLPEIVAPRGGAATLPDDGVVDGGSGATVPDHDGFALVGHGESRDGRGSAAGAFDDLEQHRELRLPENLGIVLDPARLRIDLGKFALGGGDGAEFAVEQQRARTGRALVEGEDELLHGDSLPRGADASRTASLSLRPARNARKIGAAR